MFNDKMEFTKLSDKIPTRKRIMLAGARRAFSALRFVNFQNNKTDESHVKRNRISYNDNDGQYCS